MPRSDPETRPTPGRSFGMDSDVDHRLDGTDPDEPRPFHWWRRINALVAEWKLLKSMSPEQLRHYGGGKA